MIHDADDRVYSASRDMFTKMPSIPDKDPLSPDLNAPRVNQQEMLANSVKQRLLANSPGVPTAILDGPDFVYTASEGDVTSFNFTFTFPHGLLYTPTVVGKVSRTPLNTPTAPTNQLPYNLYADNQSYFDSPPSATITIDQVTSSLIKIRVVILDAIGLSTFLSKRVLYFKFYCFNYDS